MSGTEYKCRLAEELQAGKEKKKIEIRERESEKKITLNFNTHFINNRQSK